MFAIITFLAGFYFGIIVFSLLVTARRNANNQYINHSLRGAGYTVVRVRNT